nr:MAG TPA: hypothetical protein [Caudoviricetes sp.]
MRGGLQEGGVPGNRANTAKKGGSQEDRGFPGKEES